tara:strand:+ start:2435 stop:2893 length:459 start_codon:yes stop_codon:yes gene_type:complete
MILHISIAAIDTRSAADVLASFWRVEALQFPMYEDSYIVFCGEKTGSCIEVYPQGTILAPSTPELPALQADQRRPGGPFHAALSVPLPEDEVHSICRQAGWFSQTGPRGPFFSAIEVWVEGHTLLELLTPAMTDDYVAFANVENWKKAFSLN